MINENIKITTQTFKRQKYQKRLWLARMIIKCIIILLAVFIFVFVLKIVEIN